MLPDRHTLLAEISGDKEALVKIFENRALKDQQKAQQNKTTAEPKEKS